MATLQVFLLQLCSDFLASMVVSGLFEKIRAGESRQRWLGWLSRRVKHQKFALTKKEITSKKVVEVADLSMISGDTKNRIVDQIAEYGCISRQNKKDPIFYTSLSIDMEALFVALNPILGQDVVQRLNPVYDDYSLACIVVLPAPGHIKSRMTARFEMDLVQCLSRSNIPIQFLAPAFVRGELEPGPIAKTREAERILILQPLSGDDAYLDHSLSYIRGHSVSEIAEVLTLVDPTDRPESETNTVCRKRVLLKLNLNN